MLFDHDVLCDMLAGINLITPTDMNSILRDKVKVRLADGTFSMMVQTEIAQIEVSTEKFDSEKTKDFEKIILNNKGLVRIIKGKTGDVGVTVKANSIDFKCGGMKTTVPGSSDFDIFTATTEENPEREFSIESSSFLKMGDDCTWIDVSESAPIYNNIVFSVKVGTLCAYLTNGRCISRNTCEIDSSEEYEWSFSIPAWSTLKRILKTNDEIQVRDYTNFVNISYDKEDYHFNAWILKSEESLTSETFDNVIDKHSEKDTSFQLNTLELKSVIKRFGIIDPLANLTIFGNEKLTFELKSGNSELVDQIDDVEIQGEVDFKTTPALIKGAVSRFDTEELTIEVDDDSMNIRSNGQLAVVSRMC